MSNMNLYFSIEWCLKNYGYPNFSHFIMVRLGWDKKTAEKRLFPNFSTLVFNFGALVLALRPPS